ncbi:unnamed protein product, partial [Coregonus sp. 'balchen']
MGVLAHCVVIFIFQHLTSAYDFKEGLYNNGQYEFVKDPSLNIEKRSPDLDLEQFDSESSDHIRTRRSADQGDCKSLQGFDTKLTNNTQTYSFDDLSGSVSLAWVGDATGVILALTTFQVPFFMLRFGQSKLYRSENYGKSFQDVTNLINNTFIRTEFGIAIGPENSGKNELWLSEDFGENWRKIHDMVCLAK